MPRRRAKEVSADRVTARELKGMLKGGRNVLLVCVGDTKDFEWEHLPESFCVPEIRTSFEVDVERLAGGKQRTVAVYGAGEGDNRLETAAARLVHAGFSRVLVLAGGVPEWKKAGYRLAYGCASNPDSGPFVS